MKSGLFILSTLMGVLLANVVFAVCIRLRLSRAVAVQAWFWVVLANAYVTAVIEHKL